MKKTESSESLDFSTAMMLRDRTGMTEEKVLEHLAGKHARVQPAKDGITSTHKEVYWLKKAAALGLSCAQTDLGNHYFRGTGGLKIDQAKACELYLMAATAGVPDAQCCIAAKYMCGEGVEKSYKSAFKWYLKAAEQGHPEGQSYVHTMLRAGQGTAIDLKESIRWAKLAAAQGNPVAMANVGTAFQTPSTFDLPSEHQDLSKAKMWLERAVAAGETGAAFNLKQLETRGDTTDAMFEKNVQDALAYMKECAFDGQPNAQYALACLYGAHGDDGPFDEAEKEQTVHFQTKMDVKKSIKMLKASSNQGYTEAQFRFGIAYATGWGVEEDIYEAARLFKLAADQDHEGAQKAYEQAQVFMMFDVVWKGSSFVYTVTRDNEDVETIDMRETAMATLLHQMASVDGNQYAAERFERYRESNPDLCAAVEAAAVKAAAAAVVEDLETVAPELDSIPEAGPPALTFQGVDGEEMQTADADAMVNLSTKANDSNTELEHGDADADADAGIAGDTGAACDANADADADSGDTDVGDVGDVGDGDGVDPSIPLAKAGDASADCSVGSTSD